MKFSDFRSLILVFLLAAVCLMLAPSKTFSAEPKVEILVTSWCKYCKSLEAYLKRKQVPYRRYDIEKSAEGKRKHLQLGGGGVPVVKIGSEVIRGFDPAAIDRALQRSRGPISGATVL